VRQGLKARLPDSRTFQQTTPEPPVNKQAGSAR